MPIYNGNDSLRAVHWGMNQVWKDVARHRADPTSLIGPHTTASPYLAPYLQLSGAELKKLIMAEQKLLPLPADNTQDLDVVVPADTALATVKIEHVLPMPLIDHILSTSRINTDVAWYSSPLRHEWAAYQLSRADTQVEDGDLNGAAFTLAGIFGTMMRGYLSKDNDETVICIQAWSRLSVLVDANFFLFHLAKAFHRSAPDGGDITKFRKSMQHMASIGPAELAAAEEVRQLEKRVIDMERFMQDVGLPPGVNPGDIEVLKLGVRGSYRVRMIGPMYNFVREHSIFHKHLREHKLQRWATWAFDRNNGNKLKLLQVPEFVMEALLEYEKKRAKQGGPYGREWRIVTKLTMEPGLSGVRAKRRVEFKSTPLQMTPFTDDEIQRYEKDAGQEKAVGFYNGRMAALEQYEAVKKQHAEAVAAYCKTFGPRAQKGAKDETPDAPGTGGTGSVQS